MRPTDESIGMARYWRPTPELRTLQRGTWNWTPWGTPARHLKECARTTSAQSPPWSLRSGRGRTTCGADAAGNAQRNNGHHGNASDLATRKAARRSHCAFRHSSYCEHSAHDCHHLKQHSWTATCGLHRVRVPVSARHWTQLASGETAPGSLLGANGKSYFCFGGGVGTK